ncbi:MAG: STAS domain-containing protein [Roseiflexaceae bacterium]|nr:STAS domain-containing protein [Roseiflexaceae bacterium]
MALTIAETGTTIVLYLEGRFDAHAAPQLNDWMKSNIVAPAHIILNMANVTFVDSTALATIVAGLKRCRQLDGDLYLCNLPDPVRIIFELTRFNRAFLIFVDESDARAAFEAR